jgi:hypothetical protein
MPKTRRLHFAAALALGLCLASQTNAQPTTCTATAPAHTAPVFRSPSEGYQIMYHSMWGSFAINTTTPPA